MNRYEQAGQDWDNGLISLEQVKAIALETLEGEELADALIDIECLKSGEGEES